MHFDGLARVLAVLGTLALVAGGYVSFQRHCRRRFQFDIFSLRILAQFTAAIGLLYAGGWVFSKHVSAWEQGGWALFALGGVILWWTLCQNFIRTTVLYGLPICLMQLGLVTVFGSAAFFLGLVIGGMLLVVFSAVVPVYVINRRR